MATTTEHLGLHLWQEEDYVQMEDFNSDHQTLDAYVDTVNGQLDALRAALAANHLQTAKTLMYQLAPDYFAGTYHGTLENVIYNRLDSAEETGTMEGTVWYRHPIRVGLGSGQTGGTMELPEELHSDCYDVTIRKTLPLAGHYTKAWLMVQIWGYLPWPNMPRQDGRVYHTEDYTGLDIGTAVQASLGGRAMTPRGTRDGVYPGNGTDTVREYLFELDGSLETAAELALTLHAPADHCMRLYDWALVLA